MRRIVPYLLLAAGLSWISGCGVEGEGESNPAVLQGALVGEQPVPTVHLMENHSSALIGWRRADVRDRVLVHLDGHADLDWLPDETIARIGISRPKELAELELHPYSMDATTYDKFAIWNFIYPAFRLGIVRELIWVVPDGTLPDTAAASRFLHEMLLQKMERLSMDEAAGMLLVGRSLRGEILGLPTTICELSDLPAVDEPVLLDLDLDYFTTKSALTQYVTERPWIQPGALLSILRERGIRTDLVTISLSTLGGYMPPSNRWMGHYLLDQLRAPGTAPTRAELIRQKAIEEQVHGRYDDAVARYRELLELEPEDACAWFGLAESLDGAGENLEAGLARHRALALDPILGHAVLFAGDRQFLNGDHAAALPLYERYLEENPDGRFTAYAMRRKAACLVTLERNEEAIHAYRDVVDIAPDHADSLLELGLLYRDMEAINRALGLLSRARQVLPHRSAYALALGNTLVMTGSVQEGIVELEWAVAQKPCSIDCRASLAHALIQAGRLQEAAEQVAAGLRLEPNNMILRRAAADLRQRGIRPRGGAETSR